MDTSRLSSRNRLKPQNCIHNLHSLCMRCWDGRAAVDRDKNLAGLTDKGTALLGNPFSVITSEDELWIQKTITSEARVHRIKGIELHENKLTENYRQK